jgi:acetyltransferase
MKTAQLYTKDLGAFIDPKTVAIIGAREAMTSDGAYTVGAGITKNLLAFPNEELGRRVFLVHSKEKPAFGVPSYKDLRSVPVDQIDIAVVCIAADREESLLDNIAACHEKKVKGIIMISAGYAEAGAGAKGKKRLKRLLEALGDIPMLGPNCLGFASRTGFNATFLCEAPLPGNTAFISGSGGMTVPPAVRSIVEKHGLSFLDSYGAGIDAGLAPAMEFAAKDPQTKNVVIYTEGIPDPKAFFAAAELLRNARKPVVLMKTGRSELATKAIASHSGNLAGDDDVFDAALEKAGIIRANTVDELYNTMTLFPLYDKFGALGPDEEAGAGLGHAGGQQVIFADATGMAGGKLAQFSDNTMTKLDDAARTPNWSKNNPVDIVGDADIGRFDRMIRVLMRAREVHWLFLNWDPIPTIFPDKISETIVRIREDYPDDKPIIASIMGGDDWMQGDGVLKKARDILRNAGIPHIENPDSAAVAIQKLFQLKHLRKAIEEPSRAVPSLLRGAKQEVKKILANAKREGRTTLDIIETFSIFKAYGIPVVETHVVKEKREITYLVERGIHYPVAVKLYSRTEKGSHKTDVGGVKLNIPTDDELFRAFDEIRASVDEKIGAEHFQGVVVQSMAPPGVCEVLVGIKEDSTFGSAVIFGWGGTDTEIIRDSVVALPEINAVTALRLMKRTKVWKKLSGARGKNPADIEKVVDVWVAISRLAKDFPEIKELDINPLIAYEDRVLVVDGRITLQSKKRKK